MALTDTIEKRDARDVAKRSLCVEPNCSLHNLREAARIAAHHAIAIDDETEEEAAQRRAEHEQRLAEYQAEQDRKEEERRVEYERQQKEYEAEQARRDKLRKVRAATFKRIIEKAPASFNPEQMRVFLRLLIHLDYSFLEEAASHFANGDDTRRNRMRRLCWQHWRVPQTRS